MKKNNRFTQLVLFACIIGLLYLPFLGNAFISDDIGGIVELMPQATWMTAIGWPRVIHLGVLLQYWAYHLFGLVPWPYRLTNILFHVVNTFFVWLLVRKRSSSRVAIIASLVFAIHPLAVESITWISGGVYAHYTLFFLFSLYWFDSPKIWKRIGSISFFILSLLISEKAIPLVFVFLLYDWTFSKKGISWKRIIPYALASVLWLFFYMSRLSYRISDLTEANYQPVTGMYNPFLQVSVAISSYLTLFVYPVALTLYHSMFRFTLVEWIIRICVTGLFLAFMVWGIMKRKPIGFWLSFFVIGLGITLLPVKIGWIVAERYVYLSLIGLCVVVGICFDRLLSIKRWNVLFIILGSILLLLLYTRTLTRNSDWMDADHLWVATVNVSPNDPHSWNNMGDVYARRGEFAKSIDAFTRATVINPNYADAYHNIGNTYIQMDACEQAIPFFEKAIQINPNLWQSYQNLSLCASNKKDYEQAIRFAKQALAIEPNSPILWTNLGYMYYEIQNKELAIDAVMRALEINPIDQSARKLEQLLKK